MKIIKIIILLCFLSIGISQNINRYSAFVKAQLYPSVGINYKITNHASFRPALFIGAPELWGNATLLFDIFESKKLKYYFGPSFTTNLLNLTGFYSMGMIIGSKLQLSNNFELFGEFGADLSNSNGIKDTHFLMTTGVGISYYFGK